MHYKAPPAALAIMRTPPMPLEHSLQIHLVLHTFSVGTGRSKRQVGGEEQGRGAHAGGETVYRGVRRKQNWHTKGPQQTPPLITGSLEGGAGLGWRERGS